MNKKEGTPITPKLILALRLSVKWRDMKVFCMQRTSCKGCPYLNGDCCSVASSEDIYERIASVSEEFLIQNNIEI